MAQKKKQYSMNDKFQDWIVIWGVCPGTRWYWPSAAFFVGMWVSMAIVLLSVGIPEQNLRTIMFALGCIIGAVVNYLVFWHSDRSFRSDRERCKKIKASWGSEDLFVKYSDWKPI